MKSGVVFMNAQKLYEDKIQSSQSDLKILENDTNNIIFYNENNSNKGKKKYNFWNLLSND